MADWNPSKPSVRVSSSAPSSAMSSLNVVILGAGMGKRMQSDWPKVLHPIAGRPMVEHVLQTARELGRALSEASQRPAQSSAAAADGAHRVHGTHGTTGTSGASGASGTQGAGVRLVGVYGHGGRQLPERFVAEDLAWVEQSPQLGTGHAVQQAAPYLLETLPTLILYGDVPLITVDTLLRLVQAVLQPPSARKFGLLTVTLEDPTGYGRVVRADTPGRPVHRIVEQRDATPAERAICEVNTGVMVAPTADLRRWLGALTAHNAQGEYYLTDIVGMAVEEGFEVVTAQPSQPWETMGVNTRAQLAQLERVAQRSCAQRLMERGVHVLDPERIDVRGVLEVGRDVRIDVGCIFEGQVSLADGVRVGPYCVLRDVAVAAGAEIVAFSHLEGTRVGAGARVGPYARLRPGTELAERAQVGNFVEVKNSHFGADAKASHLSYVGDATVGQRVNIGAGTITCNYDGANKHQTIIEDDVFIGSDTQLVAPVTVGRGATLGAGTTLTRDVPAGALVTTRAQQRTSPGWARPVKAKSPQI